MVKFIFRRGRLNKVAGSALILGALALSGCSSSEPADQPEPRQETPQGKADAKAAELADRLMQALGGKENWERTRYISFKFAGRRSHYWDKHQGRHRVQWSSREGDEYLILHNLSTRQGSAYKNGQMLEGGDKEQALESAYGAWINDTYWLIMPYKLRDPGVELSYDGEEEMDGVTYDKLLLRFESVGLTPGDRYWAYINRETGLMDRWAYRLERQELDAPPTHWIWNGWKKHGNIMLASGRTNPEGRSLPMDDITVHDELPDSVFTSPEEVAR